MTASDAALLLVGKKKIVVLTGAGLSLERGIEEML